MALLSRIALNPLREEGDYFTTYFRSRLGEHFITPEGIALLIQSQILDDKTSKYNTSNIAFISNNHWSLIKYLRSLRLQNGQDAKIIFQSSLHGIPLYVRKMDDKIKILIIDSQVTVPIPESNQIYWPIELIEAAKVSFDEEYMNGNLEITLSSTLLQKDTYSCFTFAFHALKYFCKHGTEIFPYIKKAGTHYNCQLDAAVLPPEKLFPEIIKLTQNEINLSDEALDTIVSTKKNLTLRQYLETFKVVDHGKTYYPSALFKKYKLLGKLDNYIASRTEESIDEQGLQPLPEPLDIICQKLFR
jgi:hypothetical protein